MVRFKSYARGEIKHAMKKTLVEEGSDPGKSKLPNQTKTVSVTMDTEETYEQIIAHFVAFQPWKILLLWI